MPATKKTLEDIQKEVESALRSSLKAVNESIQALQDLLAKGTATSAQLESAKVQVDNLRDKYMEGMGSEDAKILPKETQMDLFKASKAMLAEHTSLELRLKIEKQQRGLASILDPKNKAMQKLAKGHPAAYASTLEIRDKLLNESISTYKALSFQPKDSKAVAASCSKLSNIAKEKIASAHLKAFAQLVKKNVQKMGPEEKVEHEKALKEARQGAKSALAALGETIKSGDPRQRTLQQMVKSFKASQAAYEKISPNAATGSNKQRLSWQQSKQEHSIRAEVKQTAGQKAQAKTDAQWGDHHPKYW